MTAPIIPYISPQEHETNRMVNTDHLIPKHIGGSNNPDNKAVVYLTMHEARHTLLGTLPPHSAMLRLMIGYFGKCLEDNFLQDVKDLSEKDNRYIYKNGVRRTA